MPIVVDAEFKVEIPEELREKLSLQPGQEVAWLPVGDGFRLVLVRALADLRGTLQGLDWSNYRDEADGMP